MHILRVSVDLGRNFANIQVLLVLRYLGFYIGLLGMLVGVVLWVHCQQKRALFCFFLTGEGGTKRQWTLTDIVFEN